MFLPFSAVKSVLVFSHPEKGTAPGQAQPRKRPLGMMFALVFFFALLSQTSAQAWRSALYPADWKPGFKDAKGRFLHDFSYAGYHCGEAEPPAKVPGPVLDVTAAPYYADPSGKADSTAAIQAAIDFAGSKGGGTVFLPAGTYRLTFPPSSKVGAALWVHDDGVVLKGAGRDKTFLFLDEIVTRGKALVRFFPTKGGDWYHPAGSQVFLTRDLPNQAIQVPVPGVSAFKAGERIVLRCDCTAAFIADHGMTGLWTAALGGLVFYRRIVKVSPSAGTLTLDTPLRQPMLTRDHLRIYKVAPPLEEAGLEDLSLGARRNPHSGWRDNDFKRPGTGAWDVHASCGVYFHHALNCWIRRVGTYRPKVNSTNVHLHSNVFLLSYSRFVTVEHCRAAYPQYEGGGGNGYGFIAAGSECLFKEDVAEDCRHDFDLKSMRTTGNVFLRCVSLHPRLASDFHMHLSAANLFDCTTLYRDYIHAGYRPYGTIIHGQTTTQSVIWNTKGKAYHPGRGYIVDSRQFGWGYVIGTRGKATRVLSYPTKVSGHETAPRDWVEGVAKGDTLAPVSLYEDQLRRRLAISGTYALYGKGCAPGGGVSPALRPFAGQRPLLGRTFQVLLAGKGSAAVGILGAARARTDLSGLGLPGCFLLASPDLGTALAPLSPGTFLWSLSIPARPSLAGALFRQQGIILDPSNSKNMIAFSNGGEGRIGNK